MKKLTAFIFLFSATVLWSLPLSEQGKQESRFWMDFLEAVYQQRNAQTDNSKDTKALFSLQRLLEQEPDSPYLQRLFVAEAIARGRVDLAVPYANFLEKSEKTGEDYGIHAIYLMTQGNVPAALESFQTALEKEPDNAFFLHLYLQALQEAYAHQPSSYLEQINKLVDKYPQLAVDLYVNVGQMYWTNKNYNQALFYFEKANKLEPLNPRVLWIKAALYEKVQRYDLMMQALEQLDELGIGNAHFYEQMGLISYQQKKFERAQIYFLKTLKEEPDNPMACYLLALMSEDKENYMQAFTYITQARDYTTDYSKQVQASFYAKKMGKIKESLAILKRAYLASDKEAQVGVFYALNLEDAGYDKKAAPIWAEVVSKKPENAEARYYYARVLEKLKKYHEMEEQLNELLKNDPNQVSALNLWAYSLVERGERLEEAQQLIARALALEPNEPALMDTQAWLFFKQGKLNEADSIFSSFSQQEIEQDAEIAYHIGVLRAAQGRVQEALFYLEKAKDTFAPAKKLYNKLK